MIIKTLRGGFLRLGGYVSHVGVALLLTGVVGSAAYATPDRTIVMAEGQKVSAYGYDFIFKGWNQTDDGKGKMDVSVEQNGTEVFRAQPQLYHNDKMGATMATPAIKGEWYRDLYISPVEWQPAKDRNKAILAPNESGTIGPYKVTFLGFDANQAHADTDATVGAKVQVEYNGQTAEYVPAIQLIPNETDPAKAIKQAPVTLPGDKPLVLENFDPIQRIVILRVDGLNLPIDPQTGVVTVSIKPAISLVWIGVIVGVIGGLLAAIRRVRENRTRYGGTARAPRPVGELSPGLSFRREQPAE